MTTPVCFIDRYGIHRPTLADILAYYQDSYRSIYGHDIYIEPDSQDGQFIGLFSQALDDINAMTVSTYNAFSPSTAQGVGLSSVVKINGIKRKIPSFSTAAVLISGTVGTLIENGVISDEQDVNWNLPSSVLIPDIGEIAVTATCAIAGAISAPLGSINTIKTPVPGWQTVISVTDAALGAPIELDAQLRQRQTFSASLPENSTFEGLLAAIADIIGVVRYRGYENDHSGVNSLGIPGRSIAMVVDGGDAQTIINTIALKKGSGTGTFGTLTIPSTPDPYGISRMISYSPPIEVPITYTVKIKALGGFTADIQASIQKSLSDWTNSVGIGNRISLADAYMAARLFGGPNSKTFQIVQDSLMIARDGEATAEIDIEVAYNEAPFCASNYIGILLLPAVS